jgi:hypothetical protein
MATPLLSRRRSQGASGPTNPAARSTPRPIAPCSSPTPVSPSASLRALPPSPHPEDGVGVDAAHARQQTGQPRRQRAGGFCSAPTSRKSHGSSSWLPDRTRPGEPEKRHSAAADALVMVEAQQQRRHARLASPAALRLSTAIAAKQVSHHRATDTSYSPQAGRRSGGHRWEQARRRRRAPHARSRPDASAGVPIHRVPASDDLRARCRPGANDCNRWTKRSRVSRRLGLLLVVPSGRGLDVGGDARSSEGMREA